MFKNLLFSKNSNNRKQEATYRNSTVMLLKTKLFIKTFLPLSTVIFLFPIVSVKAQTPLDDSVSFGGGSVSLDGGDLGISWSAGDSEVLQLTNVERQKYGLPLLRLSKILSIAAMCHAKDLAENNNFYLQPGVNMHTGSNGSSIRDRVTRAGYQPSYDGENVYYQYPTITAADAVNWWINSPDHRANILNPNYTEIGIGHSLVNNGSIHRYVQVFGTPQPGSTSTENFYCYSNP